MGKMESFIYSIHQAVRSEMPIEIGISEGGENSLHACTAHATTACVGPTNASRENEEGVRP